MMHLTDAVPVWIVAGAVAAGGWLHERTSAQGERIATLEADRPHIQRQLSNMQESLRRIEQHLMVPPEQEK